MQAACSSETIVSNYKTTWCHNQEDHNIYAKLMRTEVPFLCVFFPIISKLTGATDEAPHL
jgi:hypothetical protein